MHKDWSNKKTTVAPLKQPYCKPSFKKLFAEIRTTKNFRSTKHRILQELQSNFQNKAIRNLSSYQLSSIKSEVLSLSLNFVPTPSVSIHHLIQKSATRLTQTIKNNSISKTTP